MELSGRRLEEIMLLEWLEYGIWNYLHHSEDWNIYVSIYIYHAGWNDANHQIDVANLQNFVDQMIKLMYHQSSEYWKTPPANCIWPCLKICLWVNPVWTPRRCSRQWPSDPNPCCFVVISYRDYIGAYTNQYDPICIYIYTYIYVYIHTLW